MRKGRESGEGATTRRETFESSRTGRRAAAARADVGITQHDGPQKVYGKEICGKRIRVLWDEGSWYSGVIKDYSVVNEKHLIVYDDGDSKWHDLPEEEAEGGIQFAGEASQPQASSRSKGSAKEAGKAKAERPPPKPKAVKPTPSAAASKGLKVRVKPPNPPALDGRLVGSHIDIFWPDDAAWYEAQVDNYNAKTGMHTVLYLADGVVEKLQMKKEEWRFTATPSTTPAARASAKRCAAEMEGADAEESGKATGKATGKAAAKATAKATGKAVQSPKQSPKQSPRQSPKRAKGAVPPPTTSYGPILNAWPPLLAAGSATGAAVASDGEGLAAARLLGADHASGRPLSAAVARLVETVEARARGEDSDEDEDEDEADGSAGGSEETQLARARMSCLARTAAVLRWRGHSMRGPAAGQLWTAALRSDSQPAEHVDAIAALRASCGIQGASTAESRAGPTADAPELSSVPVVMGELLRRATSEEEPQARRTLLPLAAVVAAMRSGGVAPEVASALAADATVGRSAAAALTASAPAVRSAASATLHFIARRIVADSSPSAACVLLAPSPLLAALEEAWSTVCRTPAEQRLFLFSLANGECPALELAIACRLLHRSEPALAPSSKPPSSLAQLAELLRCNPPPRTTLKQMLQPASGAATTLLLQSRVAFAALYSAPLSLARTPKEDLRRVADAADAIAAKCEVSCGPGTGAGLRLLALTMRQREMHVGSSEPEAAASDAMEIEEQPAEAAHSGASAARAIAVSPPPAPLDKATVEAAAWAALPQLGGAITLRQLRLHLEEQLGTSLTSWKAELRGVAAAFATQQEFGGA